MIRMKHGLIVGSLLLLIGAGCENSEQASDNTKKQELSAKLDPISPMAYHKTVPGVKMRYIGPGAGGAMFGMAFHPTNPDIIIFGGDMGASYRSVNGGKVWETIGGEDGEFPKKGYNMIFHPKEPNIVWVASGGVYKSIDTGKTWKKVYSQKKATFGAIGLDPDNTNVAYIAEGMAPRMVLSWTTGHILKTIDGGKTWRTLKLPNGIGGGDGEKGSYLTNFTNFIVDPDSPIIKNEGHARVYLFGRGGLFRSEDAGKTWKELSKSFGPGRVNDMVMSKIKGKTTLFLSVVPIEGFAGGGVYKSSDNGETWKGVNKGLSGLIARLAKRNKRFVKGNSWHFALLLANSKADPKRIYAGSWQGIYRSDNGGESWYELAPGEGAGYIQDEYGKYMPVPKKNSAFETSNWGGIDSFHRLVVSQSNADIVAFSDNQDMYISRNGGKTWDSLMMDFGDAFDADLYPGRVPNRYTHKVISRGAQNLVAVGVEIDPFDPNTYYAAYGDIGFQVSRDGGKSWEHPTRGTPGRGHVWSVVTDPAKKGRLFITIGQGYGKTVGGIYKSEDGAHTFKRIGLDDASMGAFRTLVIDLKSPVDNRVLYLGSEKKGVYKSVNGGKTWDIITPNFSKKGKYITFLALAPNSSNIIYAGTGEGLFKSTDAGKNWTRLGKGIFEKVRKISISKSKPTTLYISAYYPGQSFYWGRAGFWRSDDGGKTFTDITPPYFKYAGDVEVNPYDHNYIYGGNNLIGGGKNEKSWAVRSKDGGKTWQPISGSMNVTKIGKIFIDQKDPRKFFIITAFGIIEGRDDDAPTKGSK